LDTFCELAVKNAEKSPGADLVSISACGTVFVVSKRTLEQAPQDSPLYNMASDVWGHDLDSDGNLIIDGVNPRIFSMIISHLRLKAMLPTDKVPPIVVTNNDKNALNNMLAYYMMCDDVMVEVC
jgi:hypothetical protein